MKSQIFINKFQKGSQENPNIGMGTMVGIDTYSKKGVAMLAKKSTFNTGGFTGTPHFIESSALGVYIWVQCSDGSVVYSADGGVSFQSTSTAFPTGGDTHGNGLIFFQNYMIAFTDTKIYYWLNTAGGAGNNPTNGAWVDWTSAVGGAGGNLQNFATNPITGLHFPFLYPSNKGVYFGNGGDGGTSNASPQTCSLGFFGQVGTTLFNPAGTIQVDFAWNNGIFKLPNYTYNIGSIDFLPPSNLALAASNFQNPAQGADLITWDTISTNKFNPPLRIYSNSLVNATTTAGIKQLCNRNQVLYAVTGGNHSIYETNGSSFNLVKDIGLNSNIRSANGGETAYPVYFNSYPQAICVVGNKLLTGVAGITNTATYPPTNTGYFPVGIWSITFNEDGSKSTQCEFILPIGSGLVSPSGNGNLAQITCIKSIATISTSTNQIVAGFRFKSTTLNDNFGVVTIDLFKYINDINYTAIESEMFEIGTALIPQTVNNIEINLAKKLLTGQTIDLAYRTSQDQNWTTLATYTGDGTKNYYALTKNQIGATQFIQLRVRMATGSGGNNETDSPYLKTVVLS